MIRVLSCVSTLARVVDILAFSCLPLSVTSFAFKLILTLLEWRRNFAHFVPVKRASLSDERGEACLRLIHFQFSLQHILIKHQLAWLTRPPRPVVMYACAKFVSTPSLVSPNEWIEIRRTCTVSLYVTCCYRRVVKCWLSSLRYLHKATLVFCHVFDPAS